MHMLHLIYKIMFVNIYFINSTSKEESSLKVRNSLIQCVIKHKFFKTFEIEMRKDLPNCNKNITLYVNKTIINIKNTCYSQILIAYLLFFI